MTIQDKNDTCKSKLKSLEMKKCQILHFLEPVFLVTVKRFRPDLPLHPFPILPGAPCVTST